MKAWPGKDLVLFGGVGMAQTFAQFGLIDEYRLLIQPKVLGGWQAFVHGRQSRTASI
jgi:riboflavin biosynthesis pyrimidine reductase